MIRHTYPSVAVAVFAVAACRLSQVQLPVANDAEAYAVKEAALRYMIGAFAPPEPYCLIVADPEDSERLVTALPESTILVFSASRQRCVENGAYYDSETARPVVLLSVEIQLMESRQATVETALDAGVEGKTSYTLRLRKDRVDWIVESAELVATS